MEQLNIFIVCYQRWNLHRCFSVKTVPFFETVSLLDRYLCVIKTQETHFHLFLIYTGIFSILGHELQHCVYHSRSFCLRAEPVTVQKNALCTGREARSISFLKSFRVGLHLIKMCCVSTKALYGCVF